MNLVECRYNPNHRMKPSKREIHEQKCPNRFTCEKKFKYCPYDPLHLIPEKDYELHIICCESRPKISIEDEQEIERAKALNDIAAEREQILYARQKYYKGCVEEPEIPGLGKRTQQKKKSNKRLKAKFSELNNKEAEHIAAMDKYNNDNEDNDDDMHEITDLPADQNFELEKEEDEEKNKKKFKKLDKNIEEKIVENNKSKEVKKDKKEEKNLERRESCFYAYDPNDEDKDIGKYSANIIDPDSIYRILGEH